MFSILFTVIGLFLNLICTNSYFLPKEIEDFYSSKIFGRACFLTFWIRAFAILSQVLYIDTYVLKIFGFNTHVLKEALNTTHTIVFCSSIVMSIMYWSLLTINVHNIYPVSLGLIRTSKFSEFCLHILPLITSIVMSWKINFSTSPITILYFIILSISYSSCIFYGYNKRKEWPYPFMNDYSVKEAISLVVGTTFFFVGVFILLRQILIYLRRKKIRQIVFNQKSKPGSSKRHFKKK